MSNYFTCCGCAAFAFCQCLVAGTYGSEDTTENEMIGYANGRIHEMTALLVRRARLEKLHLASIRAGYKYLFVEPGKIGKAKVKEG